TLAKVPGDGISPNAAQVVVSADTNGGVTQNYAHAGNALSSGAAGWYVVEAHFKREVGTVQGAGIYVEGVTAAGATVQNTSIALSQLVGSATPPADVIHRVSGMIELTDLSIRRLRIF